MASASYKKNMMDSPYWKLAQIIAWIMTRDEDWVRKSIVVPYSGDVGLLVSHIHREAYKAGSDDTIGFEHATKMLLHSHENCELVLIGTLPVSEQSIEIENHALDGYGPYQQIGQELTLSKGGALRNERWHKVKALKEKVIQAFPSPKGIVDGG